jgi:uncharacterized cupredoxin-like copper-binding protein
MAKFGSAVAVLVIATLTQAGAAVAQTAESMEISLTDYAFTPSTLSLKTGVVYHLHLTNSGSKDLNFTAPEFFAASQLAPEDMDKVKSGAIAVDSGHAVDITVTPGQAGTYALSCTHFMHKMMGMHGSITVQ